MLPRTRRNVAFIVRLFLVFSFRRVRTINIDEKIVNAAVSNRRFFIGIGHIYIYALYRCKLSKR
jgi:hypothetical protein